MIDQVLPQGMPQVDSDWSLVGGGSDDGAEPEIPSEATRTRCALHVPFSFTAALCRTVTN